MGTVHKIGNEYYIEFDARGLKYQQKAGPDEKAAWKLLAEIEGKIKEGEMGIIVRDADVDIFLADFLKFIKPQCSAKTYGRFERAIAHLTAFLNTRPGIKKLSQLTPKVIEDYKRSLPPGKSVNPRKINLTLLLLREIFEYAIKLGYLNDNPTLHIKFFDSPPRKLTLAKPPKTVFEQFLLESGARLSEALNVRWSDVDLTAGTLSLPSRAIPLNGNLLAAFKERGQKPHKPGDRVFADFKSEDFPAETAVFRNSFARQLINNGVGLVKLAYYLGLDDAGKGMYYFCFWREMAQKRLP